MLTEASLQKAARLFSERKAASAMRSRLDSEPVALMVGSGPDMGRIDLAPAYLSAIVGEVKASLDQQIAAINTALTDMGVEP